MAYLFCLPILEGWRIEGWECTEVEAVTCQVLKLGFESSFALWKCLLFYAGLVGEVEAISWHPPLIGQQCSFWFMLQPGEI